jgi:hypothetical protein
VRRDGGTSTHQIPWTLDSGVVACAWPCSAASAERGERKGRGTDREKSLGGETGWGDIFLAAERAWRLPPRPSFRSLSLTYGPYPGLERASFAFQGARTWFFGGPQRP